VDEPLVRPRAEVLAPDDRSAPAGSVGATELLPERGADRVVRDAPVVGSTLVTVPSPGSTVVVTPLDGSVVLEGASSPVRCRPVPPWPAAPPRPAVPSWPEAPPRPPPSAGALVASLGRGQPSGVEGCERRAVSPEARPATGGAGAAPGSP
jgi:hypothetical protein